MPGLITLPTDGATIVRGVMLLFVIGLPALVLLLGALAALDALIPGTDRSTSP